MKKNAKFYLKALLSIMLLWVLLAVSVNFQSIIELIKFAKRYIGYEYLSNDLVPNNSEYKILYDLVNLDKDLSVIPRAYFKTEQNSIDLPQDSKINYYRMLLILKYLDSINVKYDTLRVIDRSSKTYSYNVFVKNGNSPTFTLLTAHYDILKRPGYQGAQDNSASVAILLNVIKRCRSEITNKDVAFLFTTMEEQGYLGAEKFMNYSRYFTYKIQKVICLDGVGRGELATMRNSQGRLGLIYRNMFFKKRVFNGFKSYTCPKYYNIPATVIDFHKYKIKELGKFLASTDGCVFARYGIPAVLLTSNDIPHLVKTMHQNQDRMEGLHYQSLIKCQETLIDYIRKTK